MLQWGPTMPPTTDMKERARGRKQGERGKEKWEVEKVRFVRLEEREKWGEGGDHSITPPRSLTKITATMPDDRPEERGGNDGVRGGRMSHGRGVDPPPPQSNSSVG